MPTLPENPVWVDGIYQLTDETPVLGKQENVPGNGPSNIQAEQLADRTLWLKLQLESIPDYREYTFYPTETDPNGTIAGLAGTPVTKIFRVAFYDADGVSVIFRYYLNNNGVAKFINDEMSARGVSDLFISVAIEIQRLLVALHTQVTAINDTAETVDLNNQQATDWLYGLETWLQRLYLGQQNQITAISDTADKSDANEIALQRIYLAQQLHAATLSEVDSQLAYLSPENQLSRLMIIQQLIVALSALEGFDPADSATASPPLLDTHFVFGEPAGIIRISVNSPGGVPPNKNAGQYPTTARLDVDGKVISFYSTLEVQGATSAFFPKKNLNITFSSTADRDGDMDLKIGDIIPHDEWMFKANWIDNTHSRQYASFLLWSQMMDSRRGWPKRDIDNCYVGKVGPDGVLLNKSNFC